MGVVVKGIAEGEFIRRMLRRWIDCHLHYNDMHRVMDRKTVDDAIYMYDERANVSMIGAAAWQAGGVAISEYNGARRGGLARPDLFFSSARQGFVTEFKICKARRMQNKVSYRRRFNRLLGAACRQARGLKERGCVKLGGIIIVPQIHVPDGKWLRGHHKNVPEFVDRVISELGEIDADAKAWVFPKRGCYADARDGGHRYLFPGTLIAFRKA